MRDEFVEEEVDLREQYQDEFWMRAFLVKLLEKRVSWHFAGMNYVKNTTNTHGNHVRFGPNKLKIFIFLLIAIILQSCATRYVWDGALSKTSRDYNEKAELKLALMDNHNCLAINYDGNEIITDIEIDRSSFIDVCSKITNFEIHQNMENDKIVDDYDILVDFAKSDKKYLVGKIVPTKNWRLQYMPETETVISYRGHGVELKYPLIFPGHSKTIFGHVYIYPKRWAVTVASRVILAASITPITVACDVIALPVYLMFAVPWPADAH